MNELQVKAFVPGIARGTLCYECKVPAESILILTHKVCAAKDSHGVRELLGLPTVGMAYAGN